MYHIVRKQDGKIKESFKTEEEVQFRFMSMGPQRNFYRIEKEVEKTNVLDDSVFEDAIQITRANVKYFYKKEGLIRVMSPTGKVLHTGKTRNMGKVFSNYVNCAKYNQSYNFNLEGGDKLFFKEMPLTEV